MMTCLAFLLGLATARAADLTLSFTTPDGQACQMALTREPDEWPRFTITTLEIPGAATVPLGWRLLARVFGRPTHGRGWLLKPEGVWNSTEDTNARVLATMIDGAPRFYPPLQDALAESVWQWTTLELGVVAEALKFAKGSAPGRGFALEPVLPMPDARTSTQGQGLILLLPDATYPEGVLMGFYPSFPTWTMMARPTWQDQGQPFGLIVRPVRVTERDRTPGYLPHPSPPLNLDDADWVPSTIVE